MINHTTCFLLNSLCLPVNNHVEMAFVALEEFQNQPSPWVELVAVDVIEFGGLREMPISLRSWSVSSQRGPQGFTPAPPLLK